MNFTKIISSSTRSCKFFCSALAVHNVSTQRFCTSKWRHTSRALQKVLSDVDDELQAIRDAGTWKHERVITTKQGI